MSSGLFRGLSALGALASACCGATAPSRAPVVSEPAPPVRDARELVDIEIGSTGACGIFEDRTAACWGEWDGGLFSVTTPAFTLRDVVELRSGQTVSDPQHFVHHFCARDTGGAVWCWGNNRDGQVGRGNHVDAATPDPVPLAAPAVALALGMRHSCALTTSGEVWCWGANTSGQVSGPGETVTAPRRVEGVAGATQIVANENSTCALAAGERVLCWGFPFDAAPREIDGARGTRYLGASGAPRCSLMAEGRVTCWGHLDDVVAEHEGLRAAPISGLPRSTGVTSGTTHACAVTEAGEVWCWGRNGEGELGTGRTDRAVSPPSPVELPFRATRVVARKHNTCARLEDRRWFCWGRNVGGMFGPSRPVLSPTELDLGKVRFTAK